MIIFELKLNISGTLVHNLFLVLFSEKKKESRSGMKNENQFLRKSIALHAFETFVRCKTNSKIGSIIQLTRIYVTLSRVYNKRLVRV